MKKSILFLLFGFISSFAQEKTTGVLNLSNDFTASLLLNNSSSTATLTLSGPNDRWFAFQFGSFESGMQSGTDVVYWNNSTLIDAVHNGVNFAPTPDSVNDWVLVSNQNNTPAVGIRTLVYTRAFDTGDSNDYVFNFNNNDIDIAWAKSSSPNFTMNYHGALNRDVLLDTTFNVLGLNDVVLAEVKLYPNPSNGIITIKSNSNINKINIYSQTGAILKTFSDEYNTEIKLDLTSLVSGIYFFEIDSVNGKNWKKVQITF
jgi:hypothetical protein